jgi:UDP-N-acetylmuramyl pentapeptide phosphotransferase/UDP-N-acetylglucosamine-1-phosphate transferase
MDSIVRLIAPLIAFTLSWLLLRALQTPAAAAWFLDHPNHRSLHATPIPRIGGLGIVLGLALGMLLAGVDRLLIALTLGLMLLSLLDDWRAVPSSVRLAAHCAAAIALLLWAGAQDAGWLQALLLALGMAWMTNLYNFMDGADGLAGGMAVIGFGAYAGAAWIGGQPALAFGCLSVAAATGAFLLFNFPPARVFMGDAGSIPLGFLAAGLGVLGWRSETWPLWFPVVVFAPFVTDATVTLVRRALRGERFWEPHRTHYYQRQVLMGWTHRQLALAEYALMALTAIAALWALVSGPELRAYILALLVALYLAAALCVDLRWRARREA